jgi:hypothetical protein
MLLRSIGVTASLVALAGLWRTKKFAYYGAVLASAAWMITALLIFVPGVTYQDAALFPHIPKIRNAFVIITWLSILIYLYRNREIFG